MMQPRLAGGWARLLFVVGVLVACAVFMFADARIPPIVIWDESRLAVNALEMHLAGPSLVTTYGFQPDLWNTKPPLMIWLMQACIALFGPAEWAIRLPSNLAAMGTLLLVLLFTRRVTHSLGAGAVAAVLLTLSLEFFGEHGARTADYDALLTFFTTAYMLILFFAVHRRRPPAGRLLLAGALVAGAVMTKTIAGLVPGFGLAFYLLAVNRWRRPFQSPWYAAAGAVAAAPVAAFYGLRELQAPGYLAAAWGNDVAGRFGTALDQHAGPPWYYLRTTFVVPWFSAGPLALTAPFALIGARGLKRQGLIFSLLAAVGVMLPISLSSTKLPQYAAPAYPFLAIATAIAADRLWTWLKARRATRPRVVSGVRTLLAVFVIAILAKAHSFRCEYLPARQFYSQAMYGRLFEMLAERGVRDVLVVERGPPGVGFPVGYAPQLRYYALVWREKGLRVRQALSVPPADQRRPGTILASCDPRAARTVGALGRDLAGVAGCAAIRLGG
jgi:4-amino-4-deoxy-L-arabinose transferase-like glycosyltransferase